MAGMLDKIIEQTKKDFDKRLEIMEKNLNVRFDKLEKKMDDLAASAK